MTQIWIKVCVENEEQTKLLDLTSDCFDLEAGEYLQQLRIFASTVNGDDVQHARPVLDFDFTPFRP